MIAVLNLCCVFVCVAEFCDQGVEDVFVFCTRGELVRYRVPCLLEAYSQRGLRVHHLPFPDGGAPELSQCCCILEELQGCLQNQRRTVIQLVTPPITLFSINSLFLFNWKLLNC